MCGSSRDDAREEGENRAGFVVSAWLRSDESITGIMWR